MSKEMTPKDALQIIQDNLTPRVLGIFPVEFHIVKEALDRSQLLEKENQELKNKNVALKIKVRAWEIQGKKYKKVIKILKDKKVDLVILLSSNDFREYNANITIRINGITYLKGNNYTLTKQEFDLLKEVLENV